MAFCEVGIEIEFQGKGVEEKGIVIKCHNDEYQIPERKIIVEIDPYYFRPTEVDLLLGDATKARTQLGWMPKYNVNDIVKEMVKADLSLFKKEKILREHGFYTNDSFDL